MTLVLIRDVYRRDTEFMTFKLFETEAEAKEFCDTINTEENNPDRVKYAKVAEILRLDSQIGIGYFTEV